MLFIRKKDDKKLSIKECSDIIEMLKNQQPDTDITKIVNLNKTQKMFLWCVANKY